MPDTRIFDQLSDFFDNLPIADRAEASMVAVALAGDDFIDMDEEFDYKSAARGLFHGSRSICRTSCRDQTCAHPDYDAGPSDPASRGEDDLDRSSTPGHI
jgi:hypothetical protein